MSPSSPPEQYRYQQDQPDLICRIPDSIREQGNILLNQSAELYGMGSVLKEYAGLRDWEGPVPFGIEHFVPYEADRVMEWELDLGFDTYLTTTAGRARVYRQAGLARAQPAGFGLGYALENFRRRHGPLPPTVDRQGTIVFPHKSSIDREREFDYRSLLSELVSLPDSFHPLRVCLYWKDYLRGDHRPFEEEGFPVVSCGYWTDPEFLYRFIDLCGRSRYAVANAIGSSFPLSVLCGCRFLYLDTGGFRETRGDQSRTFESDPTLRFPGAAAALATARFPPDPARESEQRRLAEGLTGIRHLRSRRQIRRLFHRERRRLRRRRRGNGIRFDGEAPVEWSTLRSWEAEGIEPDGWAHSRVALTVPTGRAPSRLELEWEFPSWSGFECFEIRVEQPSPLATRLEASAGRIRLRIPLPRGRGHARIVLGLGPKFSLPGEDRVTCGRLLGWECLLPDPEIGAPELIPPLVGGQGTHL